MSEKQGVQQDEELPAGAAGDGHDEDLEQSDAEASAALRAGFEKVAGTPENQAGDEADDDADEDAAQAEAEAAAQAEADAAAAKAAEEKAAADRQALLESLPDRLRRLEGNQGGLLNKLDGVLKKLDGGAGGGTGAGDGKGGDGDQPTRKEVQAAFSDPAKMAELLEVYPDFQPLADELAAIRAKLEQAAKAATSQPQGRQVDPDELRELARADRAREGWDEVVRTPEFMDFALTGGPPKSEYLAALKAHPPGSDGERKVLHDWSVKYPDWWARAGAKIASPKAADAVALVKAFDAHVEKSKGGKGAGDGKERSRSRLARAAAAPSSGKPAGAREPSADDSMRKGFRRVAGPGARAAAR